MEKSKQGLPRLNITRRHLVGVLGTSLAMFGSKGIATPQTEGSTGSTLTKASFAKDSDSQGLISYTGIHHGKGTGEIKLFRFDGATEPANFLIYDFPPGASEGTHSHFLDNRNQLGSYDEYYYIISGQGQMEIDGKLVQVAKGDHVHTPLEVTHGIENIHSSEHLRVFLTFIKRGNEATPMRPRSQAHS